MNVVSADSVAAILDEKFNPLQIGASSSVLVSPPYKSPGTQLVEPIFKQVEDGHDVVVHEAELCKDLLDIVEADIVHLDTSLNSASLEELSPVELANMKLSSRARQHFLKILPKLSTIAGEIRRKNGIEMIAIGKESIPVRIAELTAGAQAVAYACTKAIEDKAAVLLGLPSKCQHRIAGNRVYLQSLIAAEHEVHGFAECSEDTFEKINIVEMLNPSARGFHVMKITPKT